MKKGDEGPDGLLLVDKPEGPTSHDVVRMVRKALRTRRVGHAGTLDPFATGLLPCCIGRATRLVRFFSGSEKTYTGVIRLGFATDTGDCTGEALTPERDLTGAVRRAADAVAAHLTGEIDQVPPMYSAKKIDGVPLHRLARRGEEVERRPVRVRVRDWQLEIVDERSLRFSVTCSSGTYVRVLAQDLGEMLGCGAHLASLRRTRIGPLSVADAVPAGELEPASAPARLIPLESMPLPLPVLRCADASAEKAFGHGAATPRAAWTGEGEGEVACWSAAGALIGIAVSEAGEVRPDVVLSAAG